jgi:hypothetical protein
MVVVAVMVVAVAMVAVVVAVEVAARVVMVGRRVGSVTVAAMQRVP